MAVAATGDEIYTKPGQIVSAGDGTQLNLYCMGNGSPTVVFDAGHQDWAPAWAVVQPEIALWTRACSYDRAGAGFSDAGPMPRTSVRIAAELHAALHKAGVTGPYILVGHAFGGINVRTFAYRYMPEVAGLVLIDTDTGDVDTPDVLEEEHHIFDVQGAELRACRDALAAGRPLASTPPSTLQPGTTCEQRFFRGFPEKAWSADLNMQLLRVAQTSLALYNEVASELQEMPGDEVYLRQAQRSFGARPISVLTSASLYSDTEKTSGAVHLRHLKIDLRRSEAQARFLMLSSNAKQTFAYHSTSAYVQLDQPDLVIRAIREVYDQSK
jgi:pimeloyl-ACP methyl ester carboxylesterase